MLLLTSCELLSFLLMALGNAAPTSSNKVIISCLWKISEILEWLVSCKWVSMSLISIHPNSLHAKECLISVPLGAIIYKGLAEETGAFPWQWFCLPSKPGGSYGSWLVTHWMLGHLSCGCQCAPKARFKVDIPRALADGSGCRFGVMRVTGKSMAFVFESQLCISWAV